MRRITRFVTGIRFSERGAAAVEFALIAPILFAILIGTVEFGAAWNTRTQLNNAAMTAARSYTINQNVATRNNPIINSGVTPAPTAAQIRWSGASGAAPNAICPAVQDPSLAPIRVSITYDLPTVTRMFGTSLRITASGAARCN